MCVWPLEVAPRPTAAGGRSTCQSSSPNYACFCFPLQLSPSLSHSVHASLTPSIFVGSFSSQAFRRGTGRLHRLRHRSSIVCVRRPGWTRSSPVTPHYTCNTSCSCIGSLQCWGVFEIQCILNTFKYLCICISNTFKVMYFVFKAAIFDLSLFEFRKCYRQSPSCRTGKHLVIIITTIAITRAPTQHNTYFT